MLDIHVIHLPEKTTRWDHFKKFNTQTDINFVVAPAVRGSELDKTLLADQRYINSPDLGFSAGAIGCALSHRKLWEKAIAEDTPLIICEDDAIFHPQFAELYNTLSTRVPKDWDYLLLGWNFDSAVQLELFGGIHAFIGEFSKDFLSVEKIGQFQDKLVYPNPHKLLCAFGMPAYAISPRGAKKFLDRCWPLHAKKFFGRCLLPQRTVSACTLDGIICGNYPHTNSYISFPPIAITQNDKTNSDCTKDHENHLEQLKNIKPEFPPPNTF